MTPRGEAIEWIRSLLQRREDESAEADKNVMRLHAAYTAARTQQDRLASEVTTIRSILQGLEK